MQGGTIESEDWVGIQRESLRKLGVSDPEKYVDKPITAVAMDMLITRYFGGDISVPTEDTVRSWLLTQRIEPTDSLVNGVLAEHERLYNNDVFRDGVLQVLFK